MIKTVCPKCRVEYQVQEALRGKAMRCPSSTCKHVFLVEEDRPPQAPQPPAPPAPLPRPSTPARIGQTTGTVGGMVPLEQAEPAGRGAELPLELSSPRAAPAATPSWASAPPPVRSKEAAEAPPASTAPDWSNAPPPVRRTGDTTPAAAPEKQAKKATTAEEPVAPRPPLDEPPAPRGRWALWAVVPLVLLAVCGTLAGVVIIRWAVQGQEDRLRAEADEDYARPLYSSARDKYEQLLERFPESESAEYYKFRKELSEVRARITDKDDVGAILDRLDRLITDYHKRPVLSQHAADLGQALVDLMVGFGARAAEQPELAAGSKAFEQAEAVAARVKKIKLPEGVDPPPYAEIARASKGLQDAIERADRRKRYLANLEAVAENPSYEALLMIGRLRREEGAAFPDLDGQADGLIARVKEAHLKKVEKYYPREAPVGKIEGRHTEDEDAILVDVLLQGNPGNGLASGRPVFALARGVLYALSRQSGKVLWALRLGIDSTALPVLVPRGPGIDERLLVFSSDTRTLSAVNFKGGTLWRYRLPDPVLGRPVVVGNRAYLGTYKGDVHEVELAGGRRVGHFKLGHRLTLGGVHEPGSNRLYFAAHDGCVYVLRVGVPSPACEAILYSNHPAGSLRGEPFIVQPEGEERPGYLVLTQEDTLRGVELRAFRLPLRGEASPLEIEPKPRLKGWTWFPPHHDPEKVMMLTDRGVLGIFGVKQPGLRDKALFPLAADSGLKLGELYGTKEDGEDEQPERAAVMHALGNDLWALGQGRLHRLRRVWQLESGPQLVPVWRGPLELGSPLHTGQSFTDGQGRARLVAVTRPRGKPACWATCVDQDNESEGKIEWRRQLGLVARGEPVRLDMPHGPPLWLVLDQSGALFALDPEALVPEEKKQWVPARYDAPLAGPLEDNPRVPPTFLPAGDGSVFVVASPGKGKKLVIWRARGRWGFWEGRGATVEKREAPIQDALAGPPVLLGDGLLLALADGTFALLKPDGAAPTVGVDWRSERLGREVPGYLAAVGEGRFVTTDGGRGLGAWEWKAGEASATALPAGRTKPSLLLPSRVVAPPLPLPDSPSLLAVADESGLSLVEVGPEGGLKVRRRWELKGLPTSRPFARRVAGGLRVGVVVGGNQLFWADPSGKAAPWAYETEGDDIVGEPQLVGGVLVVADLSGRYVGLSPATKDRVGEGYTLRGSIAPASAAVPFSGDRLLAPLTDGTLLLLRAEKFAPPKKKP